MRSSVDVRAFSLMVFFCLIIGMQQVLLKGTGADISPVLQLALRSGIAALLVAAYIAVRREKLEFGAGNWKPGVVVGVLFSMEYLLLGEALLRTSAAHSVVFLYTSPIFSAVILHFKVHTERLSPLQWLGIALAFSGIALAFMGGDSAPSGQLPVDRSAMLVGDLLALLAGASWGLTTVVIRSSSLAHLSPNQTLLYQLLGAFVLLSLAAVLLGRNSFNPTPEALFSLGFQSVMVSFVGFLIWFWLLRHYRASQIGVLSFMTPLFGVVLGAWLLGEALEPSFLFGSALVIAGIVMVSGYGWLASLKRPRSGQWLRD
ncbi:DMT family transporter [Marinobacterium zhoushanense]|nr:DMT family transporter [Marinobacterium zhoushanense]